MRLHLVRHGATACTERGVLCGRSCDVPLSERGEAMARALARAAEALPLTALVTSPQARARMTAAVVAQRTGLSPIVEPAFCELDFGDWDGASRAELSQHSADSLAAWEGDPARLTPPRGESVLDLWRRAERAIAQLEQAYPDGELLVVAHKTTLRVILCGLLGIDLRHYRARFSMPLCGISTVELGKSGARLLRHADVAHLPVDMRRASDA